MTRGYHALAHDFSLRVDGDALRAHLEWLFAGFPECTATPHEHHVRTSRSGYELVDDGDVVLSADGASRFVTSFVHHLNTRAIDAGYALMSHAGAVAHEGVACVLPAHMESGKTTLTTGLVRAGFAYLTDEAVAFDWTTGEIEPYPKPLSIDAGSQFLFPELVPPTIAGDPQPPSDQWQVPASAIRADAVGGRCRTGYVVFPQYEEGATTVLEPMARGGALVELAKNTFEFREQPRRALDALAGIVRDAECFRLTVGDLDTACAHVGALLDPARARDGGARV